MDNILMIASSEARDAAEGEPDLIERIKKAMKKTKGHWIGGDDNLHFKAAIMGAISASTDEAEKKRLVSSFRAVVDFSLLLSGHDITIHVPEDPLPLIELWKETK